jgi:hypothetical protein
MEFSTGIAWLGWSNEGWAAPTRFAAVGPVKPDRNFVGKTQAAQSLTLTGSGIVDGAVCRCGEWCVAD